MSKQTFAERCQLAQQLLPDAQYRAMLTALHAEMLEALAEQPQMQPCAGRNCGSTNPNLHSAECFQDYEKATGLAQPEQEPVANIRTWRKNGELHAELWNWDRGIESLPDGEHDLYTRPQAREPLTDEEIKAVVVSIDPDEQYLPKALKQLARAIEAAHGITKGNT